MTCGKPFVYTRGRKVVRKDSNFSPADCVYSGEKGRGQPSAKRELVERLLRPILSELDGQDPAGDEFAENAKEFVDEFWGVISRVPELANQLKTSQKEIDVLFGRLNANNLRLDNTEQASNALSSVVEKLRAAVVELQKQSTAHEERIEKVEKKTFSLQWRGDVPDLSCRYNGRRRVFVRAVDGALYEINLVRVENAKSARGLPSFYWDVPQAPQKPRISLKGKVIPSGLQAFTLRCAEDLLKRLCKAHEKGRLDLLTIEKLPALKLKGPVKDSGPTAQPNLRVVSG